MNPNVESRIKSWLFPGLVGILATIIWQDVKEIKADVKALIAQSNKDMIRIDNLERQMYGKPTTSKSPDHPEKPLPLVSLMPVFMPTKEEDMYSVSEEEA